MDYGALLGDSWRIAWRHKYLWVLGLFSFGGSCSTGSSYNFGSEDTGVTPFADDWQGVSDFISAHAVLLLALLAAFLLLGLVLLVLSFVATAGLIAGVDEAHAGGRRGLGFAWRKGIASFWRLVGLLLLLALVGAFVGGIILLLLVLPLVAVFASEDAGIGGALLAFILVGFLLLLLLVPAGIILQIVLNWAYRSLVLEGTRVLSSIGAGWRLFRHNLGTSLVLWVLDLALNFGLGLVISLPLIAVALPVVMGGVFLEEVGPPLLAAGILLGLVLLVVLALVKAVSATFFAAYWTIAYRRLTGVAAAPAPQALTRRGGPITVAPPEA